MDGAWETCKRRCCQPAQVLRRETVNGKLHGDWSWTRNEAAEHSDGQMTMQRDTPLFRPMLITTPPDTQDVMHAHELCQCEGKYRYYTEVRVQLHSPAALLPVPTEHEAEWTSEPVCCPCRYLNP